MCVRGVCLWDWGYSIGFVGEMGVFVLRVRIGLEEETLGWTCLGFSWCDLVRVIFFTWCLGVINADYHLVGLLTEVSGCTV